MAKTAADQRRALKESERDYYQGLAAHKERCGRIQALAGALFDKEFRVGVKGDVASIQVDDRVFQICEVGSE